MIGMKRFVIICCLLSFSVCNAQISTQYPALKDSAYLYNPQYQQGNKYQRDAMLFIGMLSDTHPYYIQKARRDSLLMTVPKVLDACGKCDSDTAFTQILYGVLGKLHDKHSKAYHQKAYYRLDSVSGQFCHLLLCHTIKKTDSNYG